MVANIIVGLILAVIVAAIFWYVLPQLRASGAEFSIPPLEDDGGLQWLHRLRVNYTEDEMRQMLEEVRSNNPKISFYARKKGSKLIYRVLPVRKGFRVVPLLRGHATRVVSKAMFAEQYEYLMPDQ